VFIINIIKTIDFSNVNLDYSLKGAIKQAIFYDWIKEGGAGHGQLKQLIYSIENFWMNYSGKVNELEDLMHQEDVIGGKIKKAGKERKTRQEVQSLRDDKWNLRNEIKSLNRYLGEHVRKLESQVKQIEDKLFESVRTRERMPFSLFQVADSLPFKETDLQFVKTERVHLEKQASIPIHTEAIAAGVSSSFRLKLDEVKGNVSDSNWTKWNKQLSFLKDKDISQLFGMLNSHAQDLLKRETGLNDKLEGENKQIYQSSLGEFYKELESCIYKQEDKKALLRIGFGKSWYNQSIGLALYFTNKQAHNRYCKIMKIGKPHQTEYPVTRTMVCHTQEPAGWVLLERK